MAVQAHKVSAYSDWGNLKVNMDKSTATAALHQQQPYDPYDHCTISRQVQENLTIQGTPVNTHSPKEAFRYLGIYMTMDLNWKYQYQKMYAVLQAKIANLTKSMLNRRQKTRVLESCLRPMVTYTFYAAPYTISQLANLDSQFTLATKAFYKLGKGVSRAMTHEDISNGGLGCHSLLVEYYTILAQRIVRSVRDQTTHGHIYIQGSPTSTT